MKKCLITVNFKQIIMKNIILKISFTFLLLFATNVNAQLPLQYGDAVVTHSRNNSTASSNAIVIRTIKSSNTSTAPLGVNWNTATMNPAGTKPANWNAPNWTYNNLGAVFGITLDTQVNPNIYVSNNQIHFGAQTNGSKVWRLDGTTGAHTLVYNFNNNNKSLGNLKYKKIGGIDNIYVSNFDNGNIERLTGSASTGVPWAMQPAFNPKFGLAVDDPNFVPYGLAIRNMAGNIFRLYYAKTSLVMPYSTNEIWSVALDLSGNILAPTEQQEIININLLNSLSGTVIADIAFTSDGNKMLLGQQTLKVGFKLGAHHSNVVELVSMGGNTWVNSSNIFPAGRMINQSNCTGGVSYSDNVLQGTSNQFSCDTTVAFSSDYIYYNEPLPYRYVYGMQFMNTTPGNTRSNSIIIDQDEEITYSADKYQLGDIEVYKNPQACAPPCNCGTWDSLDYMQTNNWWVNTNNSMPPLPVLTYDKGQVSGILFPHYTCSGNCNATFNYSLIDDTGNVLLERNDVSSIELISQNGFNKLDCGSYAINITPKCGNSICEPIQIPLVIVCPPECSDCGGNAKVETVGKPVYSNGMLNVNLTIANDKPVSEVRVLVEEFRITSANGNENCILCKNTPKTWGSVQTASLSGINVVLSNIPTIDNREIVFNNNGLINLNPTGSLVLNLAMPNQTDLDCCTIKVELCLKVIIRDIFCCEKEVLKCFTFELNEK